IMRLREHSLQVSGVICPVYQALCYRVKNCIRFAVEVPGGDDFVQHFGYGTTYSTSVLFFP
ncbi:TPA: hypothetical protein ACYEQ9_004743, partial [Klebsiella pneumoniae]|uniref:hypothetical protein n=1 Tax=Klebsiella pneumoniae TaxID=573 RepID=UPI001EE36001